MNQNTIKKKLSKDPYYYFSLPVDIRFGEEISEILKTTLKSLLDKNVLKDELIDFILYMKDTEEDEEVLWIYHDYETTYDKDGNFESFSSWIEPSPLLCKFSDLFSNIYMEIYTKTPEKFQQEYLYKKLKFYYPNINKKSIEDALMTVLLGNPFD